MAQTIRLTRHADVVAAATDPVAFSSRTSAHLHVPNGMDGEEHRAYRAIVDRQMTPEIMAGLAPMLAEVAESVVAAVLDRESPIDAVTDLGEVFAVRAQCRWLGWPAEVEQELIDWMAENYAASRAGDYARNAEVAAAFDALVARQIAAHRAPDATHERADAAAAARRDDAAPPTRRTPDATDRLLAETINGRPLSQPELVSILRNWTAGDLGSLARCIGVIVWRLVEHPRWQHRMRELSRRIRDTQNADSIREFDAMLDECLRIDDPFVANRRVTTCPVTTASGEQLSEGTTVLLDWTAANQDPAVFSDRFDPEGHAANNLVFGIGPHICPGKDLSFAELRAITIALLLATNTIEQDNQEAPTRFEAPLGGWSRVPVRLR